MRTVLSPAMRKVHQRELFGGLWVDISVKTLTQRRRHSRRACFPDQGKGGPPRGAAGTPWRLGRSCHPTQLASQQCTQMAQNGSEVPFSPICVHSCVTTVVRTTGRGYGSRYQRLHGPRDARALGPDTHAARAVTQLPTHTSSRSGEMRLRNCKLIANSYCV